MVYERNLASLAAHELRWARTVRAQRPLGYASLFVTQPLLCALFLAVLAGLSLPAGLAVAGAAASRVIVSIAAQRVFPKSRTAMWAIPLRDALTAAVWIGGFFTRRVHWRVRALSVEGDGRLGEA
jgi:ceramide glucosyltransferase